MTNQTAQKILALIIRMTAVATFFALIFVFGPFEWMIKINEMIGLAPFEYTPLMSYLTRSLSALYAILGAILMLISFDLPRYKPLLSLLGWIVIVGGIAVTYLDAILRFPLMWTIMEGPMTILLGVAILWLLRYIQPASQVDET